MGHSGESVQGESPALPSSLCDPSWVQVRAPLTPPKPGPLPSALLWACFSSILPAMSPLK